ncbi:TrkA-N domain protein [Gloeothece citriformis PCC 7424]|uniref:TrkA-N domain protein n=1 Tax=Gloeothece citriformis (strain PCC 7424) TaxID=65393 RepID=B7KLB9_GLOC7|nr:NAD-binding protein [Gloeothece citriformis]ACK72491.1 TrkA-N domain protein [Gloeothece citriformis PCC 7424]
MYLIIVGAGIVAQHLISLALDQGYRVGVIEKNQDLAQSILKKYDVDVFQGNIAEGGILDEAEADKANAIIATTEDDSVNLMAMLLGKEKGIKTLIAVIQENQHQKMFEHLGVQVIANPEKIIAQRLLSLVQQ